MLKMASEDATQRLSSKKQTLDDAYAAPANFLEIDVINPITHGIGNKRYTDYEVRMKVIIPGLYLYLSVAIIVVFVTFTDKSTGIPGQRVQCTSKIQ